MRPPLIQRLRTEAARALRRGRRMPSGQLTWEGVGPPIPTTDAYRAYLRGQRDMARFLSSVATILATEGA